MAQEKEGYKIRLANENDIDNIASLVVRLKKLNEEFDPLLKVREDALKKSCGRLSGICKQKGLRGACMRRKKIEWLAS